MGGQSVCRKRRRGRYAYEERMSIGGRWAWSWRVKKKNEKTWWRTSREGRGGGGECLVEAGEVKRREEKGREG
jgi:hypothetical protein